MKSYEQVLDSFKSECLDGRDLSRLVDFIEEKDLARLDVTLKPEYVGKHKAKPFTRENILTQLQQDVAFGFEKALDQRGISASMMYQVVSMWNRILEDGLENFDTYAQYGLPLFRATAVKYGWDNPIGEDSGSENRYAS